MALPTALMRAARDGDGDTILAWLHAPNVDVNAVNEPTGMILLMVIACHLNRTRAQDEAVGIALGFAVDGRGVRGAVVGGGEGRGVVGAAVVSGGVGRRVGLDVVGAAVGPIRGRMASNAAWPRTW